MSGFSPYWLLLREPPDHRARNSKLRAVAIDAFGRRDHVSVVDLACGTGSNLRGLAPYLPSRQTWRLVDHDPRHLAAAYEALIAFAGEVRNHRPLILRKSGKLIEVHFERLDLKTELAQALAGSIDLVTTSAFFDLVSPDWIGLFCAELSNRKLPLYSILNYDGEEVWRPPHAADGAMLAAFHRHQTGDKGFGPAAGPKAAATLQASLQERGYTVSSGRSPWRLSKDDARLIETLAHGVAKAVSETGLVPQACVEDWREMRVAATECKIGHTDLFAALSADVLREKQAPLAV